MKKQLSIGIMLVLLAPLFTACGNNNNSKNITTSKAPAKGVSDISISLGNDSNKAYITVRGTQKNYTAEEFKWTWGLKAADGTFADGKSKPSETDYVAVKFDENNAFTVKYCLTDIKDMKAGVLYTVYGGTPETYGAIPFASNQFGASDEERKYYLRQDQDNALIYDSIQPVKYTKASVVEIKQEDLPEGVTATGAYLKVGGINSKNLTVETLNEYHDAGRIAGDFQRVIGDGYSSHAHDDTERFYKIEENYLYVYLYIGFIQEKEGWMVHLDLVGGSTNAGLSFENTLAGETPYTIDGITYRLYADKNKGNEENYWGCLGVYRDANPA